MINETPSHPLSYNHEDPMAKLFEESLDAEAYQQSYSEMPTKLEMAISLFQKLGTSEGIGSVHPISVRIPTIEYSSIQAMSKHAGLSVNKVIVELLQVGLDEVWQGLNDENRRNLVAIRAELLRKLVEPGVAEGSTKGEI
jgi:hypothetical protein